MSFQNFGFPYETPYKTQIELMNDIYDVIESRKIGLFESPTGTVIFMFEFILFILINYLPFLG